MQHANVGTHFRIVHTILKKHLFYNSTLFSLSHYWVLKMKPKALLKKYIFINLSIVHELLWCTVYKILKGYNYPYQNGGYNTTFLDTVVVLEILRTILKLLFFNSKYAVYSNIYIRQFLQHRNLRSVSRILLNIVLISFSPFYTYLQLQQCNKEVVRV